MKKQIGMTDPLLPSASLRVLSHIWRMTFAIVSGYSHRFGAVWGECK